MQSYSPDFFWLHIKKCGGGSVRRALAPDYSLAPRVLRPVNFIQSPPHLWNDILNNFRMPLGEFQFRRALFAKRFLYPDSWDTFPRFAFVRHPIERLVSAFFYLQKTRGAERSFVQHLLENGQKLWTDDHTLFDRFLELVQQAQTSEDVYQPVNLHFTTHLAPVWGDVTGENGEFLLSRLYRLEHMNEVLNEIRVALGRTPIEASAFETVNVRCPNLTYEPSPEQKNDIKKLYPHDFDLYENAHSTFLAEGFR